MPLDLSLQVQVGLGVPSQETASPTALLFVQTAVAWVQEQEATLKTYLDDMSDLLLNHNLRNSKPGDEVRQIARERTLTALRRLKADRNKIILQFLQDARLISMNNAVIDLSGADLSDAILSGAFDLTQQQLDQVYTCTDANLPRGLICHQNPVISSLPHESLQNLFTR